MLTSGPCKDLRMPHPDYFIHPSSCNDVGFGTEIESIDTLRDLHVFNLTVTKEHIKVVT